MKRISLLFLLTFVSTAFGEDFKKYRIFTEELGSQKWRLKKDRLGRVQRNKAGIPILEKNNEKTLTIGYLVIVNSIWDDVYLIPQQYTETLVNLKNGSVYRLPVGYTNWLEIEGSKRSYIIDASVRRRSPTHSHPLNSGFPLLKMELQIK